MDPNVKRITWVARKCMLFGLAFLAVGLLLLFVLLTAPARAEWATPGNVAILVGVLVLLGAIFVCVRVGVVVNRQQRTITTWWGLLVPLHKTEHPFSQAHVVTLSREERPPDSARPAQRNVIPSAAEREESGRWGTSRHPDSSPSTRLGMT